MISLAFFLFNFPGHSKIHSESFPGGAVVMNPPASAGDVGLSSGPGRSHMLRGN